jgi:glycosyltransferase involved in cell wall biosynthesis
MRVVGISNRTRYWQQYVFGHSPEGYRYERMVDIPWHMLGVSNQFLSHTKYFFPLKRADLYHTYNSIVVNRRPWVMEVESYLPRYKPMRETHPLFKWGVRRLLSDDLKALIFTSRNTMVANQEALVARGLDPACMSVIYRAVEQYEPLPRDPDHFTILFVGNGFYRKGGVELLKAFERLGRPEARLVIVSSLEVDWGVEPDAATIADAERRIAADPRITHHRGLSHDGVIDLMRRSHVFVSTTFADPFNNTVLEAMGTGLPIISSRISSIPEMVDDGRNGILLPVEGLSSDSIADAIAQELKRLMDDAKALQDMGRASLEVVRERFDISVRNRQLKVLYDRALR